MAVFDTEQRPVANAQGGHSRTSGVSLRVALAVLASIVAIQTIAIAVLLRRPLTTATSAPLVVSPPALLEPSAPTPSPVATAQTDTTLSIEGNAGAAVFVDGQRRGVAPLTVSGLAPGKHQVAVATADGTVSREVNLLPSSSASVLFSTPRTGWIDVRMPFAVSVLEGTRQIATSGTGPINLAAGTHVLTLINDELGFRAETRVTVNGGDLAVVRPAIPQGVLQINALPWANVFVDGEPAGDTPIGQLRVPVGSHEVRFVHPQYGERRVQVVVPVQPPARVSVDLR
jgi:hypothetical protein